MGENAVGTAAGGIRGFAPALTTFIGRLAEVDEVAALLQEYRLVTVTGPGGVGKTRLAEQVARRLAGQYADGSQLVELGAVAEAEHVTGAAAVALGIPQVPGKPADESLAEVLSQRQQLLVLDNCEHVLGSVAALCRTLLTSADDLRILATSREPIAAPGEALYRLQPLPVPAPDSAIAGGGDAVALFVDRARRSDPHFALDDENALALAQLVTRLDGMPLAIELAAARVYALGLPGLINRLDQRLRLLTSSDRTAPARQQSLAAAVDWSYRLLPGDVQRVFRQLALLPAPFSLDAAEQITGASAEPAVLHLVDCSLLNPPRTGPDGRARYAMLETVRAFGLERLTEAGDLAETADALARYAQQVAETAANGLKTSTGELAAVQWLDAESTLLHQALAWALKHEHGGAAELAVALTPWWYLHGRYEDAYQLLSAAAASTLPGSDQWCTVQICLGEVASGARGPEDALGHFTAACGAASGRAGSTMLIDALAGQANCLMALDHVSEGEEVIRHALALSRELGYLPGQAVCLGDLAMGAYSRGDIDEALRWATQACAIDPAEIPGTVARQSILMLANTQRLAGFADAARRTCAAGLSQAADAADLQNLVMNYVLMADIERQGGYLDEAARHLRAGLELVVQNGAHFLRKDYLDIGGHLCTARGQWEDAVTLWSALMEFLRAEGIIDTPQDAERRRAQLRIASQTLGSARMSVAEARGSAMAPPTALKFAALATTAGPQPALPGTAPEIAKLSAREQELVTLVAQGHTDTQIAGQLFISVSTVRSHLDRIRDKTSCRRRADLTRLALRAGLA